MSDKLKPDSVYLAPPPKYLISPMGEEPPLTKREHFAGLAMQGMLASGLPGSWDEFAEGGVKAADALIAELEK